VAISLNFSPKVKVACQVVLEKKAQQPKLLDVRGLCSFADYFLICTADAPQQTKAIAQELHQRLKELGTGGYHQEGEWDSGWVLLDYGELIVHIFAAETRGYYNLEELWQDAACEDVHQLIGETG